MLDKKILISGCGITYTKQQCKTWGNILKLTGLEVIDTSGPAVSNQWILNRAINYLLSNKVDYVIIQLSSLGKLDVEVDSVREQVLVQPDTLRNFTVDGVWPSSASLEHPAKKMWFDYLYSPGLELQDIDVKLRLLKSYCEQQKISLLVLKGYDLPGAQFNDLIHNSVSLNDQYRQHDFYKYHREEQMSVPCIEFQFQIAYIINQALGLEIKDRLDKIQAQYWQKNH